MAVTKAQPEIVGDECIKCGVPTDEICERCGCDCDGHGGLKTHDAYCPRGCKTAHGDSEHTTRDDEAAQQQLEQWQEAGR